MPGQARREGRILVPDSLLDELYAWLRIPSVSSGDGDPLDLERAARWVCDRIEEAGGTASVVPTAGNPLAVGELRSFRDDAPTVLIYGHYDVQSVAPIREEWHSHPFEPEVRDGRLYARGASDDKGNFLPLLHVACRLALAGELPVHVRVLVEGEEEVGGHHALDWLEADERGADCAIVFDSGMEDEDTPALTIGVRGIMQLAIDVRTAPRNLHSGMYGGAALNASHALIAGALAAPAERRRAAARRAARGPDRADRRGAGVLGRLAPGSQRARRRRRDAAQRRVDEGLLRAQLVRAELRHQRPRERRRAAPAHDPARQRARAMISIRLAPGQDAEQIRDTAERLIREAAPAGAELTITRHGLGRPAIFDPSLPALKLAARGHPAGDRQRTRARAQWRQHPDPRDARRPRHPDGALGLQPARRRPARPNESYRLASLYLGESAAERLYAALSELS